MVPHLYETVISKGMDVIRLANVFAKTPLVHHITLPHSMARNEIKTHASAVHSPQSSFQPRSQKLAHKVDVPQRPTLFMAIIRASVLLNITCLF